MKICVDVRCLAEGRRTGVEEYTRRLLWSIFEIDRKNEYVLFFNSAKSFPVDFSWVKKYPNVSVKKMRIPNKLLNFSFWYLGWPRIDKLCSKSVRNASATRQSDNAGADVVFLPNIIFAAVSSKSKLVLTIHDLSFERYPEYFSLKRRLWHAFVNPRKICKRADKIIAVSDSTQEDITEIYKISRERISVIPSAVAKKFRVIDRNDSHLVEVKEKYSLPYKFILFLGTIEPRKNIESLIDAFERFQEKARQKKNVELQKYELVIAGSQGWLNEKIYKRVQESCESVKIRMIHFVPEKDKKYLYNLASLFVFPSFFEGFGFPPLEAMKCGIPVISSANSSLSEVSASAAVLIDPDRPEEICEAAWQILSDKKLYENLVKRGLKQSGKFSWEKTAQKTLAIFEKVARN